MLASASSTAVITPMAYTLAALLSRQQRMLLLPMDDAGKRQHKIAAQGVKIGSRAMLQHTSIYAVSAKPTEEEETSAQAKTLGESFARLGRCAG